MGHEKDMEEKRYRIIGTAGHIDHGKTWLVKALTGTDTDRLAEEKRRGITIENGFAFLKFPDGREAGIIDVPGHEKFIKNMLAGAGGIDIAMVVIAADEGARLICFAVSMFIRKSFLVSALIISLFARNS